VWDCLAGNARIDTIANIRQGFSFARAGLVDEARRTGQRRTGTAVPAFLDGVRRLPIWKVPAQVWLDPSRTPVNPWRNGAHSGEPQVLVNDSPVMCGPWRIKALLDWGGHAVPNTYTTIRPLRNKPSVAFLWALLNSPLANAYVYCNALKRQIYDALLAAMPLPQRWEYCVAAVVDAAETYLKLVEESEAPI